MKKDTKSLLWGLIAGSVAGSVTALLFAPKPGKELRQDIKEGTAGAIDKVQEIAGQAGDKGAELYGKAKDAVNSVVTEIKEWRKPADAAEDAEAIANVSSFSEGEITDSAAEFGEIAAAAEEAGKDDSIA
ncbi:YtxH domain-containing protein [Paenibacillus sp. NFR01]|uniref:YtxH domain-containing protein n=1 Tax=Paenibacillus sp. NFR01 TaxID=1566279 RepID=UPI0008AAB22A|nr:YtxH domain-containing protein [Paenibacillus sp. NFR01]SES98734.1 Gas vesicle protein [Paenibacillus sp. NFR01]